MYITVTSYQLLKLISFLFSAITISNIPVIFNNQKKRINPALNLLNKYVFNELNCSRNLGYFSGDQSIGPAHGILSNIRY